MQVPRLLKGSNQYLLRIIFIYRIQLNNLLQISTSTIYVTLKILSMYLLVYVRLYCCGAAYVMKLFVFGFLCENVQDICRLMKSSLVKMSENIDNIQNVATYILVCIYKVSSGKNHFLLKFAILFYEFFKVKHAKKVR